MRHVRAVDADPAVRVLVVTARVPAAAIGLHYYTAGLRRAVATLGLPAARQLFLAAEPLDATALRACGFLDACVACAALEEEVRRRGAALEALAPPAVQGMKCTLRELAEGTDEPAVWRQRELATHASADFAEGIAAVRARRAPVFRGA
ncbi:Methylmalonyl-CoA decarboxylase [Tepidimonas alkaliphilus]|uniref:Methylmalonyl-CoA decarboxylase n=1 Tax=Tepidimonas alkaliphilus TaxID=2588942 RepID=A0A554W8I3_9BURK|nr:hypothetical protein [Tepidimonas alkaliphilus]TSE19884.1 Methylmalonyl-CoA decarboxylase [Tepidimonas alkaliphilus]